MRVLVNRACNVWLIIHVMHGMNNPWNGKVGHGLLFAGRIGSSYWLNLLLSLLLGREYESLPPKKEKWEQVP